MTDPKTMNKDQLLARINELEAKQAKTVEPGRIWPDVSKAIKEGIADPKTGVVPTQGMIVFRGVNANAQRTLNMYASQMARFVSQLPSIVRGIRDPKLWPKLATRTEEERTEVAAVLDAYLESVK